MTRGRALGPQGELTQVGKENKMRRISYALIVVLLFVCVYSNYQIIESHSNSIKYINNSIGRLGGSFEDLATNKYDGIVCDIYVLDACVTITDGYGHASGVAVQNNLILTAGHVIDIVADNNDVRVIEYFGREYKIISYWRSDKYDIGFLRIDGKLPCLELGAIPELLDEVYLIGAPYSIELSWTITKGIISYVDRDICGREDLLQTDAEGAPGSSGGSLLNTEGKIIGICVTGPNPGGGVVLCEPVSHIQESLDEYLEAR